MRVRAWFGVVLIVMAGLFARRAHAAGGAYLVDDASITPAGHCQLESWIQALPGMSPTQLHVLTQSTYAAATFALDAARHCNLKTAVCELRRHGNAWKPLAGVGIKCKTMSNITLLADISAHRNVPPLFRPVFAGCSVVTALNLSPATTI